jgi:hypothetical protein
MPKKNISPNCITWQPDDARAPVCSNVIQTPFIANGIFFLVYSFACYIFRLFQISGFTFLYSLCFDPLKDCGNYISPL